MAKKKEFNIDQALDRLEEINKMLAEKDVALNEALDLYKEGATLASKCKEHLTGIEKELILINEEQGV